MLDTATTAAAAYPMGTAFLVPCRLFTRCPCLRDLNALVARASWRLVDNSPPRHFPASLSQQAWLCSLCGVACSHSEHRITKLAVFLLKVLRGFDLRSFLGHIVYIGMYLTFVCTGRDGQPRARGPVLRGAFADTSSASAGRWPRLGQSLLSRRVCLTSMRLRGQTPRQDQARDREIGGTSFFEEQCPPG